MLEDFFIQYAKITLFKIHNSKFNIKCYIHYYLKYEFWNVIFYNDNVISKESQKVGMKITPLKATIFSSTLT